MKNINTYKLLHLRTIKIYISKTIKLYIKRKRVYDHVCGNSTCRLRLLTSKIIFLLILPHNTHFARLIVFIILYFYTSNTNLPVFSIIKCILLSLTALSDTSLYNNPTKWIVEFLPVKPNTFFVFQNLQP